MSTIEISDMSVKDHGIWDNKNSRWVPLIRATLNLHDGDTLDITLTKEESESVASVISEFAKKKFSQSFGITDDAEKFWER